MTEIQKQKQLLSLLDIKLPVSSKWNFDFAQVHYHFQPSESANAQFDSNVLPLILEQAGNLKIKGAVQWFIYEVLQNVKDYGKQVADNVTVDLLSDLSIDRPRISVRNSPAQYFDATKYLNRSHEELLEQITENNTHIALDVIVRQANYVKLTWNTPDGIYKLYLKYDSAEDKILASSDKQGKRPYMVQISPGTPVNSFSITSYFKPYSDDL
jgi:hypothetical protein